MKYAYEQELLDKVILESTKGKNHLKKFLEALLTPQEYEQVVTRLQIVKQLKAGRPQRDIAKDLEVGIATVTRGSRELVKGSFQDV